jgi:hypothetical protein
MVSINGPEVHDPKVNSVISASLLQRVLDRPLQRHRMALLPSRVESDLVADGGTPRGNLTVMARPFPRRDGRADLLSQSRRLAAEAGTGSGSARG